MSEKRQLQRSFLPLKNFGFKKLLIPKYFLNENVLLFFKLNTQITTFIIALYLSSLYKVKNTVCTRLFVHLKKLTIFFEAKLSDFGACKRLCSLPCDGTGGFKRDPAALFYNKNEFDLD